MTIQPALGQPNRFCYNMLGVTLIVLTATLRTDPVSREQQAMPCCATCGSPAHLDPIPVDLVLALTTKRFGVAQSALLSPRRAETLVVARAFAVWTLRSLGRPLSYRRIGIVLCRDDHKTVTNLHQKAIWLRLRDPAFKQHTEELAARFYAMREHV